MVIKTAFLGLGVMGGYMAANLAQHGYPVKAWNRTPNRPGVEIASNAGAEIVSSIEAAVNSAEVVFTCVGDVPDVEAVILGGSGVVQSAQPGTIVVDFSTIGPTAVRRIATELQSRQLLFLDAPISGGDIGAKNGTLTIMVGGDRTAYETCEPLFAAMGKTIRYCGETGSGQAVKLCNQVLAALNMVGICEAMLLAQQQGVDPRLIVEVCGTGAAGSWALSNLGEKVATADFDPGFMIKHMVKDLRLVQESLDPDSNFPGIKLADDLFKAVQQLDQGSTQGTQAMIRAYHNSKEE
ncbi:MAG: NAD(P)-dependent oxidoreductase [Microcoleaceae cyanobacterium]